MHSLMLPRTAANEAAPFYHSYITEVASENLGDQLVDQLREVERLCSALDDRAALARYAPGKWSIKEVLGHITDAERIFAYRLLRVCRGDPTPLPGFDENAYVAAAGFDERALSSLLAEFRAVRQSTMALSLGISPGAWSRWGSASGHSISGRALLYVIVGHTWHHLTVLRDRYGLGAVVQAVPARHRV